MARYLRGSHRDYYPFGFAMNGQTARLEATREIIFNCNIKTIIETGTFRGTTTEWFATFGLPVISIESHVPTYEFARRRLARYKNVSVGLGNSVELLRTILPQINCTEPIFVYLDAHWEASLPLKDEIDLICRHLQKFVVLVDDFQVPGDQGYTFDNYGPGKALTENYLQTCESKGFKKFYPSVPSAQETGGRRGWVVLAQEPDIVDVLSGIGLLKASVL